MLQQTGHASLVNVVSRGWISALSGPSSVREEAQTELRILLLRGARFELDRRRRSLGSLSDAELNEMATRAADDAMTAILAGLGTFPGASRFSTWASKFVLREAAVKARQRAWRDRAITLDWSDQPDDLGPDPTALRIVAAMQTALTPQERTITSALALEDVPIDVLAERLHTTRAALYATLHGARRKLRTALAVDEPGHA
jgi:RNA polymerase sigma-70 factor (ECF subfamily)